MGADSYWSSPFPWGTPSMTSTRTTVRASSFSVSRWAVVAPTFPAPTTVILLSIAFEGLKAPKATLAATRMHLTVWVSAQPVNLIERRTVHHSEPLLGPSIRAAAPRRRDQIREPRIARTAPQRLAQIDASLRVQAQQPCAISRQPTAVA